MKNIVIFGGAFDPIHNGHLNMAINASKQLDADVIFVPARISVWKKESASVEDKIKMIALAIKSVEMDDRFFISKFEADSPKEVNYTIDTVKYFKDKFKNANLFLLIGTDQVNSFHKWKDCELISQLTKIIFFERDGYELDKLNISYFKMIKIDGNISGASSTDIRNLRVLDTPFSVIRYISKRNLYFMPKVRTFYSPNRLIHVLSVAELAYQIAESNNLDIKSDCYIAGLLHDVGKNLLHAEEVDIMRNRYPEFLQMNEKIYHQFTGEYLVKRDFNIENSGILTSIKFHTTGRANMSLIEKIVYCADKIDPTRGFDSSDLINAMKVNVNDGFITVLKANRIYFEDNGVNFRNELTLSCMNYYL